MERYQDQPFVLLGVNSDPDREALKQTLIDEQLTWRSWWDEGSVDGPIHTQWQVLVRPTIHLIDAHGVLRHLNVAEGELEGAIDELLAEAKPE